jgi:hypothetical protein
VAKTYPADAIHSFSQANPKFSQTARSADLLAFRDYLSGLLEHVEKRIKAGDTKETIVAF